MQLHQKKKKNKDLVMPEKNPENWVVLSFIAKWIFENSQLLASFALSFVVAVLRTIKEGKVDLIEASLCGMLTLASWSMIEYIGFPQKIAIFVGGMIAWLGTAWCKKYVKSMLLWALTKAGLMKEKDF
jgi:lambda family phage holin